MQAKMIGVGRYINLPWNHSDALVLHQGLDVPDKDFWFSSHLEHFFTSLRVVCICVFLGGSLNHV